MRPLIKNTAFLQFQWLVANTVSYVGEEPPIQMQQGYREAQSALLMEQPIHNSTFLFCSSYSLLSFTDTSPTEIYTLPPHAAPPTFTHTTGLTLSAPLLSSPTQSIPQERQISLSRTHTHSHYWVNTKLLLSPFQLKSIPQDR